MIPETHKADLLWQMNKRDTWDRHKLAFKYISTGYYLIDDLPITSKLVTLWSSTLPIISGGSGYNLGAHLPIPSRQTYSLVSVLPIT